MLFGTAAICNQCGITPTTETNVTVITQAAEITEEKTAATPATTTAATTATTTATTTAATTATTTAATTATTTAFTAPPEVDLVITGIAPKSTDGPSKIIVLYTIVGPDNLYQACLNVVCHAEGFARADPSSKVSADSDQLVSGVLGDSNFSTSMIIDVSLNVYPVVYCQIGLDGDPTPDNNIFSISIP